MCKAVIVQRASVHSLSVKPVLDGMVCVELLAIYFDALHDGAALANSHTLTVCFSNQYIYKYKRLYFITVILVKEMLVMLLVE